jgi:hypothetical protein
MSHRYELLVASDEIVGGWLLFLRGEAGTGPRDVVDAN